jgi:hypothetical protein
MLDCRLPWFLEQSSQASSLGPPSVQVLLLVEEGTRNSEPPDFILYSNTGPGRQRRLDSILSESSMANSPSYSPATSTGIGNCLIASRRPTHCYSYRLEGSFIPAPDFAGGSNQMHMCLIPMIYPYVSQPVFHFLHYAHEWRP